MPVDPADSPLLPAQPTGLPEEGAGASAVDAVAAALRERIGLARLAPGARLGEVALAEELGVSRNSLREAFAQLVAENLLVRYPHRGVFVVQPGARDVEEIFRARRVIELGALQYGRLTSAQRQQLEYVVASVGAGVEVADDPRRLGDANQRLHTTIVGLLASADLDRLMASVLGRLRLSFQPMDVMTDLHLRFAERNRLLARLILTGDRQGAIEVLEPYLDEAEALVLDHIRER